MARRLHCAAIALLVCLSLPAYAAEPQRQAEVARRGADVMPFSLDATMHVFTKTGDGGVQRVVARNKADAKQIALVRTHLQAIRAQFLKGDFSGPAYIHGDEMPGLAELKAARPGEVAIGYRDVPAGAELTYRTTELRLVSALHLWFDAQVSEHGADAGAGHPNHGDHRREVKVK